MTGRKIRWIYMKLWTCLLIAGIVLSSFVNKTIAEIVPKSGQVDISYEKLINRSIITQSGDTIAQVLEELRTGGSPRLMGLLQPYFEPFSYLCNHIVSPFRGVTGKPFVNITDYYPGNSPQPAWVSLFKEGHYQLYFNENTVRLFLKGKNPLSLFASYHSVVRHPLRDIFRSFGNDYTIEVYAFRNDYKENKIVVNLNPYVTESSKVDLSPRKTPLDIESLEEFFNQGVIPEAMEVDDSNRLYFYGRRDNSTIASKQLSIADFATIYRAISHHGYTPPYISFDKHEDNRYAKVNFGGSFENTGVGSVLLEADKLFKTLSTGIDPSTQKDIRNDISRAMSMFITENERSLLAGEKGHSRIRYWFYPDEISTVTDGRIGAIENHQFMADVERTDLKTSIGPAQQLTIRNLNRNYDEYAKSFRPLRELNIIGRMMALAAWLNSSGIKDRVDLDALLSVNIPVVNTPQKIRKILAVTAIAYGTDKPVTRKDIRANAKVFNLSEFLDRAPSSAPDDALLDIGNRFIERLEDKEIFPTEYFHLKNQMDAMRKEVDQAKKIMAGIEEEIDIKEKAISASSPIEEIEEYNKLVAEYNNLVSDHRSKVKKLNQLVNLYNSQKIRIYHITSVGGGINLNPKNMKGMRMAPDAGEVERIRKVRAESEAGKKTSIPGAWVRSSLKNGKDAYIQNMTNGLTKID